MKVLYDNQIFEQSFGGISNCFSKQLEILQNSQELQIDLPIKYHQNQHLKDLKSFSQNQSGGAVFKIAKKIFGKKRVNKYCKNFNRNLILKQLELQNFDIFHPTYYDPYFLSEIKNKPYVLDIHDMTPEVFPEMFYDHKNNEYKNKKLLSKKANKIIAVSQNTKADLMNIFNISEDKIEVIHHANPFEKVAVTSIKNDNFEENLPKKYILFVGNRSSYKNFYFFLTAIKEILIKDNDLSLVCLGGGGFSKSDISFMQNLGLENKVQYCNMDNIEEAALVYKNARLFAFPSLYEGFGLPILEAFSCKCPVAASGTSSIPEVAGDGAIYFEPKSMSSIQNAIEKLLYNEDFRLKIIENGSKRLKDFSWQKNVEKTIKLYKEL